MTKPQKITTISIIGFIILFVCVFIAYYFTDSHLKNKVINQNQAATTTVESYATSTENAFLGQWDMKYISANGNYDYTDHVGFITTKDGLQMRTYLADEKNIYHVYSFGQWAIRQDDNKTYLQEFSWNRYAGDTPLHEFILASTSPNLITLTETNGYGEAPRTVTLTRLKSAEEEASVNFTLSNDEHIKQCQKIVDGESPDYSIMLPITCTLSLGPDGIEYSVAIAADGALTISQGNHIVFTLSGDDTSLADSFSNGPFYDSDAINFEDVTFDGWKDMAVETSAGAYNFFYDYYVFNPLTKTFTKILSDMVNPTFDASVQTLESFEKGRGIGDIYEDDTYKFINGMYVLVKQESQDFLNDEDDSPDAKHRHIILELKNNVWATTTDEIVNIEY